MNPDLFRTLAQVEDRDGWSRAIIETILSEERRAWAPEEFRANAIAHLRASTHPYGWASASDFRASALCHIKARQANP